MLKEIHLDQFPFARNIPQKGKSTDEVVKDYSLQVANHQKKTISRKLGRFIRILGKKSITKKIT